MKQATWCVLCMLQLSHVTCYTTELKLLSSTNNWLETSRWTHHLCSGEWCFRVCQHHLHKLFNGHKNNWDCIVINKPESALKYQSYVRRCLLLQTATKQTCRAPSNWGCSCALLAAVPLDKLTVQICTEPHLWVLPLKYIVSLQGPQAGLKITLGHRLTAANAAYMACVFSKADLSDV